MKDPVEVRLPSDDRLLVMLRMEKSRGCISPALLDDIPLDLRYSSALGIVSMGGPDRASLV